jgi:hypothetical protein
VIDRKYILFPSLSLGQEKAKWAGKNIKKLLSPSNEVVRKTAIFLFQSKKNKAQKDFSLRA